MLRNAVRHTFGLLLVAAVVGIPTVASAHGGNDDPNVVHACVGNVSKVARIVGVAGTCITSPALAAETPAHWDIRGPAGKDGTNGESVTFAGNLLVGDPNCPNGGALYLSGSVPAYVCNGTNGKDGKDGKDGIATRAHGPCFDSVNRYVDCGNGTVTDTVTGLIWLKQPNCLPTSTWVDGNQSARGLKDGACGLTDKSSEGDWRLPTKEEWLATIARAVGLGCPTLFLNTPALTDDAGTGCYNTGAGSSFAGVLFGYWSSTSEQLLPSTAFLVSLPGGYIIGSVKTTVVGVWPVRGGSR